MHSCNVPLLEIFIRMSLNESFMEKYSSWNMKEIHEVKSGNYSGSSDAGIYFLLLIILSKLLCWKDIVTM